MVQVPAVCCACTFRAFQLIHRDLGGLGLGLKLVQES